MCLIKGAFVGEKNFERYQNVRYNNKNNTGLLSSWITWTEQLIHPLKRNQSGWPKHVAGWNKSECAKVRVLCFAWDRHCS